MRNKGKILNYWYLLLDKTFYKNVDTKWLYVIKDKNTLHANLDLKIPIEVNKSVRAEIKDDLNKIEKQYKNTNFKKIKLTSWIFYDQKRKKTRKIFLKELGENFSMTTKVKKLNIVNVIFKSILISILSIIKRKGIKLITHEVECSINL